MMKDKLFFTFRKDKVINIILIIQLTLSIFCIYNFLTTFFFKTEYTKLYNSSYDIENGIIIKFTPANISGQNVNPLPILKSLEKNNIKGGIMLEMPDEKYSIPLKTLNISPKLLMNREEYIFGDNTAILPIKMNYTSLNRHSDKINGQIEENMWKIEGNTIPVVVGVNFSNKFKIGDIIKFNGNDFHIIGVMSESILYQTHYDSILTAKDTSGKFIIPIEDKDYTSSYNNDPIIISNSDITSVETALKDFSNLFEIRNYGEDYEWFSKEIKYDLFKKNIRTLILMLATIGSLFITLLIKILSSKDRFGILYSLGFKQKEINNIFILEFSPILYIIIITSFILTNTVGKFSFRRFLVQNKVCYWGVSIYIVILLIIICFKFIFNKINKLSPKEMMEDFNK